MSADRPAWVADLLKSMRGKRIAVAGDIMLDEWLWGSVQRISPEAPVPVVEVSSQSFTLGGAGNVANNLAALGAKVRLLGVVGTDEAGQRVLELCRQLGIDASGVAVARGRPTTRKTRIVAHNQQVVRADREVSGPLDARSQRTVLERLRALDGLIDGAIVSDYAKGMVSAPIVHALLAHEHRVVVSGDPKPHNLAAFAGVDCIAPNLVEAASAAGMAIDGDATLARAAAKLLRLARTRYVLVTRGEHGMTLFGAGSAPFTVPAIARQVYDVSGAGDTVISALTLALAAGAPIRHAVVLASLAAGVVVEKLGTATATAAEIGQFAQREGVAHPTRLQGKPAKGQRRARRR
ncbi:MAG TPA: PfkB family carbohydrate kinase [Candidatus Eremiobacteraceae bacterium]|nr:PfkB family carbohydrate kinase [Candidatus Eremiobacteraceae bacterium]